MSVSHFNLMAFDDLGTGGVVVLIHGFPFNRSMWREQIEFLSARDFRVVAPDLRGLGENVAQTSVCETSNADHRLKSVPPATMEDMARDVAALMDRLTIDRATICGLSMGCYVAFEFIHLFPARVHALVLCGPRAQGPDDAERKSREAQAQRVLAEGMQSAVASISTMLLAQKTLTEKPEVVTRVSDMVLNTDPRGAAAAQRGMATRRDYSDELANITVPTLVVAGREDGVRKPEDAEFIHRSIHGSQLVTIDDAGHLMNMEQPQIFNRVLIGFFERLTR
ncbi:MAG TPA: alpha/beta fold hydrolase [Pyrinomonadaceae bacterium]